MIMSTHLPQVFRRRSHGHHENPLRLERVLRAGTERGFHVDAALVSRPQGKPQNCIATVGVANKLDSKLS